MAIIAIYRYNS